MYAIRSYYDQEKNLAGVHGASGVSGASWRFPPPAESQTPDWPAWLHRVITSYSIHYTKLYDVDAIAVEPALLPRDISEADSN